MKEVFCVEKAEIVCSIPISQSGLLDKQIWAPSKNVIFSVKSAYHLELSRKRKLVEETSYGSEGIKGWKTLWKLIVPGVVKIFMWKVLNKLPLY